MDWYTRIDGSGVDEGWHVHQLTDGGYMVGGWSTSSASNTGRSMFFARLDSQGALDTVVYLGDDQSTSHFQAYEIHPNSDGNTFIAVGRTDEAGYDQLVLLKLDSNLGVIWEKRFGDPAAQKGGFSVKQTADGGYIAVGFVTYDSTYEQTDVYVLKTDANGALIAESTFDNASNVDFARSVAVDNIASEYVLTGYTRANENFDIYLIRGSQDLSTVQFETTIGDTLGQLANDVKLMGDGSIAVSGLWTIPDSTGISIRGFLLKADGNGVVQWQSLSEYIPDQDLVDNQSVTIRDNGELVTSGVAQELIPGSLDDPVTHLDAYWSGRDASGTIKWERTLGDKGAEFANWVQPTSDGGFITCGTAFTIAADSGEVFVMKTVPAVCGDVNNDGGVDISDITYLVNFLFEGGPPPPDMVLANADGSCPNQSVDIGDVSRLSGSLFADEEPRCPWCP